MSSRVRCTRCNETKAASEFAKSHVRTTRTGEKTGMCRPCNTEYQKELRHRTQRSANAKVDLVDIVCSICAKAKPATEYRWNSRTGYRTECKECEKTWLRCSGCKEAKVHDKFPPARRMMTGRHSVCNLCHNKRSLVKYHGSPEQRARHRDYYRTEEAKQKRRERDAKPGARERQREYHRQQTNWLYHNDPEYRLRVEARAAVNFGVKFGFLKKPDGCQSCGKYGVACSGPIEAHHHKGYAKENWLEVEWLCVACHKAADQQLKQARKDGTE